MVRALLPEAPGAVAVRGAVSERERANRALPVSAGGHGFGDPLSALGVTG